MNKIKITIPLLREFADACNQERHGEFKYMLGDGTRRYTPKQKEYAINMVRDKGVRATARILGLHRKTLQRWLRAERIHVERCPDWVFEWAYWRRKRNEKWERIKSYRQG